MAAPPVPYLNRTVLLRRRELQDNGFVLQLAQLPLALAKPVHQLPPLILHPISRTGEALTQGSASDTETLRAEGRRLEMRMLCCLGKDLTRWLEQCVEFAAAQPELAAVTPGELMDLLVERPPESVSRKMQAWGVADFRNIFARALGLAAVFPNPPTRDQISDTFVRDFARYAEMLYRTRRLTYPPSAAIHSLHFDVYASGEYAQILERSWGL
ncbi:MAG TPA: hypothetical protein VHW09_09965 [Bryobacteraceae bacterium]|jgi:hypothetical protein|nr:hypothetical protein [Bryobacteraceae bacterium]